MQPTLVIMAAGLGSRFGGVKQLARVGRNDEAILDFSILDGRAAGFGDVVLVVRGEILDDVRAHVESQHRDLPVRYVLQEDLGPARDKPWGTLHAVLSAAGAVDGSFAVINADDYYGPRSFELAADALATISAGEAVNIAFQVGHTVPPKGAVTRAVTDVVDGYLHAIVETDGCQRNDDGTFSAGGEVVPADTPVSMNLWCFHGSVFDDFGERWKSFHAEHGDEPKAECQLPTVVGELMADERLRVAVVPSPERWIGITNPDDFELAKQALAER